MKSLDATQKKIIGTLVRKKLDKNFAMRASTGDRNLIGTPQELAARIGTSVQSIYKMHSGEFSVSMLNKVSYVLDEEFLSVVNSENSLDLNTDNALRGSEWEGSIPFKLGGYKREQVEPYLGNFAAVRRSFSQPKIFFGTYFTIDWDEQLGGVRFIEENSVINNDGSISDFSQHGTLHISGITGTIHLLTHTQGAMRLISLSHMQPPHQKMFGIVLTQASDRGVFRPIASHIHFKKLAGELKASKALFTGVIDESHNAYKEIALDLEEASEAFPYS